MGKLDTLLDDLLAFLGPKTRAFQPGLVKCCQQYSPKPIEATLASNKVPLPEKPPTISVVVPTLNQATYLEKAIKSLVDQRYPHLELIVVDGGSTDGSVDILQKYQKEISWWCSEPDSGQTHALNKGFACTNGEIMGWLNSDDQLLPEAVASVASFMAHSPKVDAVYGHRILIDENDQEIGRWILPPHDSRVLTWEDFIPQETLFWRRALWEKVGGKLDETFSFAMDWDLLLRFRKAGAKMVRLPRFVGLFRIHAEHKTLAQMEEIGVEEMKRLRSRCLGYMPPKYQITFATVGYLLKARILELMWKAKLIQYD